MIEYPLSANGYHGSVMNSGCFNGLQCRSKLAAQFLFFGFYIPQDKWKYLFAISKRSQQIRFVTGKKTILQFTIGGQTHPVTAAAKRFCHGADDGKRTCMPGQLTVSTEVKSALGFDMINGVVNLKLSTQPKFDRAIKRTV